MTSNTFYTLAVFAIVLLIITKPIGLWLTPIAQGRAPAVVDAIDRRLISVLAGSVRISVSGEVIPGAAQRGCPLFFCDAVCQT